MPPKTESITHLDFMKLTSSIIEIIQKLQDQNLKLIKEAIVQKGAKGDKGDSIQGPPGPQGPKPIAGKDYPIPKAGRDYPMPQDGYTPVKGKDYFDGKPGADAPPVNEAKIAEKASTLAIETLKTQLPTLEQLEQDLPKLGHEIRNALELLQDDERLDAKAIKGLPELLDELRKTIKMPTFVGPGNSSGGRIVKIYDLSSQLNGVLSVFSLPAMWRIIDVKLFSKPTLQPLVDWVYDASAHTLTFGSGVDPSTDLATDQICLITYAE